MKKILSKVNTLTERIEKVILSLSVLLMMLNTTINAIGRYVFHQSIYFSEELNQFLMVSVTFVGLTYAVRYGRNIRMTAIYDSLSHKNKKFLTIFIAAFTSFLMFVLAYEAFLYIMHLKKINRQSPALQIEMYLVFLVIPIGFLMTGVQFFIRLIQNLFHSEIYLSYDVKEENHVKEESHLK